MADSTKGRSLFLPWVYDMILWICTLAIDLFFREIQPRGAYKIPKSGPLIIVAGPHANQFVDSIILMRVLKSQANRRISFLIAEKSMKEPFIGTMAGLFGSLPVARAMDNVKTADGKIYVSTDDETEVHGIDTDFTSSAFMVGGTIVFPRVGKESPATATISEIINKNILRLKKAANIHDQLREKMVGTVEKPPQGVAFKIAPHIDQRQVFDAASRHLLDGGCIGIFPEGGSHDRTDLLPLKAGVSIMALNTLAKDPDCGLTVVPCGMNYFHAHKFRSRAVIEFGSPIDVHPDQIKAYESGGSQRRNAVGSLLETINEGLTAVTQPSPDYDTMMLVQETRRLYIPRGKKLPLSAIVELNRRLMRGYARFGDDARVIELKKSVLNYKRNLRDLGIKDHQVEWGDTHNRPWWVTFCTLLYRLGELLVLATGTLPGLLLFWPVFVTSKVISKRKQDKALAASVVKVRGRDVVSTWKLIVSAGLAPALYLWYTAIATLWLRYNRFHRRNVQGVPNPVLATTYVPEFVPLWMFALGFLALMVLISFAALRIGEIGMDIVKSLPPLFVALNPFTSNALVRLRAQRQSLATQVQEIINTLGPKIFEDFDRDRIIPDPYKEDAYQSQLKHVNGDESPDHSPASPGFDLSTAFNIRQSDESMTTQIDRKIRDAMQIRGRDRSRSFRAQDDNKDD